MPGFLFYLLIRSSSLRIHCCEVIRMKSCDYILSLSALACCLAEGKSSEEIALLSSVLVQLGDTLATIAAHEEFCESDGPTHC